jgi:hypothetical protein
VIRNCRRVFTGAIMSPLGVRAPVGGSADAIVAR